MKRTFSAVADAAVCIGRETVPVGVYLITNCTNAVPHNLTLFIEFDITIVPESICGLFIDQRSKVLPVVVIPCVLSRPIVGSDESCDGAVKLVDS